MVALVSVFAHTAHTAHTHTNRSKRRLDVKLRSYLNKKGQHTFFPLTLSKLSRADMPHGILARPSPKTQQYSSSERTRTDSKKIADDESTCIKLVLRSRTSMRMALASLATTTPIQEAFAMRNDVRLRLCLSENTKGVGTTNPLAAVRDPTRTPRNSILFEMGWSCLVPVDV